MISTPLPSYTQADWQLGYRSLTIEDDYAISEIEGQIPVELEGTLFRNGPGKLEIQDQPYGHPFDGDGMIVSISLQNGQAHFRNRFVQTPDYLAEQQAGRILYRGVFGTQKPGGWWANFLDFKFKNPANTNVVYHGGKLLALWEASLPWRLDPATLATLSEETYQGTLGSGQPVTAHPKVDPATGDLISFGVRAGLGTSLFFYRMDPQGNLTEKTEHSLPGFAFLHDFAWTGQHRIFFQNPIAFNPLPFALGLQSAGACLQLDPKAPTRILVYDLAGSLTTLETDPGFVFHFVNAYQDGEQLIVDAVFYEEYPTLEAGIDFLAIDFDRVPAGKLARFSLNLKTRQVSRTLLLDRAVEFPTIHPNWVGGCHRYLYIAATHAPEGNAPLQTLLKLDCLTGEQDSFSLAPRGFAGEPVFVPRPGSEIEDDGWILSLTFDAASQRSVLMILDAQHLAAGPVAQVKLRHAIPYGLHGGFVNQVFSPTVGGNC